MRENNERSGSRTSNLPGVLLLTETNHSSDDQKLSALLDFFGVPWSSMSVDEALRRGATPLARNTSILSSASDVAAILQSEQVSSGDLPSWMREAGSVYVYGFQDTIACQKLFRFLTDDSQGQIRALNTPNAFLSVTSDFPKMCGPLSGMRVAAKVSEGDLAFDLPNPPQGFQAIISTDDGVVFCALTCGGVRFYLNASCNIVDLARPITRYFDVKDFFCGAVPITMYLKCSCHESCWNGSETSACLVVDDPLLKSRYGFLRFREVLELMDKNNFAMTIGLIPWNWHRTNPSIVRLFKERFDRLSISVHGCDHTASEFAARSTALLNTRIKSARRRMDLLHARTSLPHDPVMIFPQGAFSPEAGLALKLNDFAAAVNTEIAPSHQDANYTKIADVWDVAIMKYGTFPIFTRRYLHHGIENFAFDKLLGKPCLIVGHHEIFKDEGRDLVEFIGKLNSLNGNLHWRPLGNALGRSFKVRQQNDGSTALQMYAGNLILENSGDSSRDVLVIRQEGNLDCVKAVMVNQKPISSFSDGKNVRFHVSVRPKQTAQVQIAYFDKLALARRSSSVGYSAKTRLRRYLSEFRDNYLSRSEVLTQTAALVKQRLSRSSLQKFI